ncbi:histone-lysine N-methyltransferase SETMAR [Nephila pilipes]|uniref:Histone-lysine N-methyltransferase SETMAR n=1 Tax=Nephila pilipes TaxID=299642 RepID=A0A8X6N8G1_NEPPI|nr:histone-lysine N-methyltransferase SETMAR [Nephila pilipes]
MSSKGSLWTTINGQTVIMDLYSQQLDSGQQTKQQKKPAQVNRKDVLFFHDNSEPHVSQIFRDIIQRLDWKTLCHPSDSSDLTPLDYHLFHSLDNNLREKVFTNEANLRQALTDFFASQFPKFYCKEIEQLETRW